MNPVAAVCRAALSGLLAVALATALWPAAAVAAQDGRWWQVQWRMQEVWEITDGAGVTVAVVDTGMDASLPEFAGAVVSGADFTGLGGDGTVDLDDGGHGTGVASLIAARPADGGVVGVAPGATVLPIATGRGPLLGYSDARKDMYAQAIRYAVEQGAQVINISQGLLPGLEECPGPVADAVRYAIDQDVVVVAGSGNTSGGPSHWPGTCPGVLTVGATEVQLAPWHQSHRSEHVDVAAPGVDVRIVRAGGEARLATGTSAATALVSGAVALVRAAFPQDSARQVVARILATVEDIGAPGWDDATGYGLVVPYRALTEPVPPDAPNPVFDALGEPSDVDDPGQLAVPPPATARPEVPPPAAQRELSPALLLGAGAAAMTLVLLAIVVGIILVVRSGRHRAAAPPAPPGAAQDVPVRRAT